MPNPDERAIDQGLHFDVDTLLSRRPVLRALGYGAVGAGLIAVVGCSPGSGTASAAPTAGGPTYAAALAECAAIPEETAGPAP